MTLFDWPCGRVSVEFDVRTSGVPIERAAIVDAPITVYRADLAPPEVYAPYVKCCILRAFLLWAKSAGYRRIGYYASRESFWVGTLKMLCDGFGLEAFITHPKTKSPPDWADKMSSSLHYLKPNIYAINYAITRKRVESDQSGLMLPMGIDMPAFVGLQTEFFNHYPLPKAASYIVPTGSGTAASCVSRHLMGKQPHARIYAIATRPTGSVSRVLQGNDSDRPEVEVYQPTKSSSNGAPSFIKRGWERIAYAWLADNIARLRKPICFLNLGA